MLQVHVAQTPQLEAFKRTYTWNQTNDPCCVSHACRSELIAFKTAAAGNASQPSTFYVQYQDANGLTVGTQALAPGAGSFTSYADCFGACDARPDCAGITAQMLLDESKRPTTCQLITGVNDSGLIPRTFVRADATRLHPPLMV
jgi:hypothetical protein